MPGLTTTVRSKGLWAAKSLLLALIQAFQKLLTAALTSDVTQQQASINNEGI